MFFYIKTSLLFFIKAAKVFIILGMNKPSVLFMFKKGEIEQCGHLFEQLVN